MCRNKTQSKLIYSSRLSKHWILFASSSFISFLEVLRFYSDVVAMPSQKYNPTSALQQQQRNHMETRRTVIGQFWLLVFTHTSFWCRWKTGLRLAKRPLLTAITALYDREWNNVSQAVFRTIYYILLQTYVLHNAFHSSVQNETVNRFILQYARSGLALVSGFEKRKGNNSTPSGEPPLMSRIPSYKYGFSWFSQSWTFSWKCINAFVTIGRNQIHLRFVELLHCKCNVSHC